MKYTIDEFKNFLENLKLDEYRKLYQPIKIVEMDLDKPVDIQPLNDLYNLYWNPGVGFEEIPDFDKFYAEYLKNNKTNIDIFWKKSGFGLDCDCFSRGLKARIYRTWASIITQIYAAYVAESVFGNGTVFQSTDLDHKNTDILVTYENRDFKFQIKKKTGRSEIARMADTKEKSKNIIYLFYEVVSLDEYNKPRSKKRGHTRKTFKPWAKQYIRYNSKSGFLDMLDNGFVVFTQKKFKDIKEQIDSKSM